MIASFLTTPKSCTRCGHSYKKHKPFKKGKFGDVWTYGCVEPSYKDDKERTKVCCWCWEFLYEP